MTYRDCRRSGCRRWLAPVAAVLLLAGCHSPDDQDEFTVADDLTGTITGIVLDSNGTPLPGVVVSYGGSNDTAPQAATTSGDGQFRLEHVSVTGLSGVASNDANGPITLLIKPPPGYMGATVQVNPQAQASGSVGGGTVFVDGFVADTGPVRLPAQNTAVSAVLRSASTGLAVAGARVSLDFLGPEFDQDGNTGVATTYNSGSNPVATSDEGGKVSFPSAWGDACLRLTVTGYTIGTATGVAPPCSRNTPTDVPGTLVLSTPDENGAVDLGALSLSQPGTGDTVPPTLAGVDGVIDPTQNPAQLDSSITSTLTLRFSEPLSTVVTASRVFVYYGRERLAIAVTGVTMPDTRTAVVTLETNLPAATLVEVDVAREVLRDTAGNGIVASPALAYDSLSSQNLVLSLLTYGATAPLAATPGSR